MIILSTPEGSGINSFVPSIFSSLGKKLPVQESYRRRVPFFLLVNVIIGLLLFYLWQCKADSDSDRAYSFINPIILLYIVLRMKFGKHIITITVRQDNCNRRVAPVTVWLDYISLGVMFFLMGTVSAERNADNEILLGVFEGIRVFFFIYALLPFMNYAAYRLGRK